MTCREAFAREDLPGREYAIHIDKEFPNFECESCSVSEFSKRPVHDDEELLFLVIHPIHFDVQRGTLVPAAFDQLISRDLSTIRLAMAVPSEIDRLKEGLIARGAKAGGDSARSISKGCVANTARIRSETDEAGVRQLGVYDTAMVDNSSHASVLTRADILQSRPLRMKIRMKIYEIFREKIVEL